MAFYAITAIHGRCGDPLVDALHCLIAAVLLDRINEEDWNLGIRGKIVGTGFICITNNYDKINIPCGIISLVLDLACTKN